MNLSFYTGAVGAISQQERMDIIANNIANINTDGYKSKSGTFSNLVYTNLNAPQGGNSKLKSGVGVKVEKTDVDMSSGAYSQTDGQYDFTIIGEGLFGLKPPNGNEISYTRDGSFMLSKQSDGKFYLANKDGYLVIDRNSQPIEVKNEAPEESKDNSRSSRDVKKEDPTLSQKIAVFRFGNYNDMRSIGGNRLMPVAKNGAPQVNNDATLQQGVVETSNVDFAKEMSRMIETQRAYQFALRMVTTSDEVEGIINSLRG